MSKEKFIFSTPQQMIDELEIAGRSVRSLVDEIQSIYVADEKPWIIGFSGGKDSTTVLSLIYSALQELPEDKRTKPIYVVSSDTLVETPVVINMVDQVLDAINSNALTDKLPMSAHPVYPKMDQTFWVNLLGRGYPAPTTRFRWCTERMKIDPVSEFILSTAAQHGEVVVVLGARSAESASRAQVIAKHKVKGTSLGRHSSLPNAYTYMPIESWSADEVWEYLMSAPCPWGGSNRQLFDLYKGSNQGECPLVIDKSTPSCGNSRFGCWTCTVVTEDRALHGLIESGATWMKPLLDFRNLLWKSTQGENSHIYRNSKRRTGRVTYAKGNINDDSVQEAKLIRGPYLLEYRREWLQHLLEIECKMRGDGRDITLIREAELQAIRQQWLRDPNEPDWEDSLPAIYSTVYPDHDIEWIENDAGAFTEPDALLLKALEKKHGVPAEMIMKLIDVELSMNGLGKRKGILGRLETIFKQDWDSFEEASERRLATQSTGSYSEKMEELKNKYAGL